MKVDEIMTTHMEEVDGEKSVYDAVEKMVDRRIRALLVRFPGPVRENGVITARDVVYRVLARGIDPKNVKVAEIASRPLVCVDTGAELQEVALIMAESGIARVFVCGGESIIGVVAMLDIMAGVLIMRARGENVFQKDVC